jgi:putative transposase
MTNHVHLVVVPTTAESLAAVMRPLHSTYAQWFHTKSGGSGYLWNGRFFSCALDDRHFWAAIRYVENNPVRAGMVCRAEDYPWSSARAHCGLRHDPLIGGTAARVRAIGDWSKWLAADMDEKGARLLRSCTRSGRPAGDDDFVDKLEQASGMRLRPMERGRPPKCAE